MVANNFAVDSTRPEGNASRTILVVDDDPLVSRAISVLISRAGYSPMPCGSAEEAIHLIRDHAPSAALIDIHLPGHNGLHLSQKIRDRHGPDVPIIILSGDTSIETINSLPRAGATYFFPKPVNATHLLERLREWVK